jgi:hypothetical protein
MAAAGGAPECSWMTSGAITLALKVVLNKGVFDYSYGSTAYKNGGFYTIATKEIRPLGSVSADAIIDFLDKSVKPYAQCKALASIKAINLNGHGLTDNHILIVKHILDNYTTIAPERIQLAGNTFTPEGQAELIAYLASKNIKLSFAMEGGSRHRRTQKVKRSRSRRRRRYDGRHSASL